MQNIRGSDLPSPIPPDNSSHRASSQFNPLSSQFLQPIPPASGKKASAYSNLRSDEKGPCEKPEEVVEVPNAR